MTLVSNQSLKETSPRFLRPLEIGIYEEGLGTTIPERISVSPLVLDQATNGWITYVKEQFYSISGVEAIYLGIDENNIDFWLIIPNRDFAVVRQLVDCETKILDSFATTGEPLFLFEFHIVYRCGADESQFVPRRAIRLPR